MVTQLRGVVVLQAVALLEVGTYTLPVPSWLAALLYLFGINWSEQCCRMPLPCLKSQGAPRTTNG